MSDLDTKSKTKLAKLMAEVQPVIDRHISEMNGSEVDHILTNYRKYLKIDIERDLEKAREQDLKSSPFDEILNDTKY
jgi:hypothetical protein